MNKSLTTIFLISVAAISGCGENKENFTTNEANVSKVTPQVASLRVALSQDVPKEILGYEFVSGGKCSVDAINNAPKEQFVTINLKDGLKVDGWAFDDTNGSVPSTAALQLVSGQQRYYAVLSRHGGRNDLISAFGNSEYAQAGYEAEIDIFGLPTGQYDILVIQKSDKKNLVCPTYRKLIVNG